MFKHSQICLVVASLYILVVIMSTIKAVPFISDISNNICCPFFNKAGQLHALLQESGEIITINDSKQVKKIHTTGGQPSGAAFDQNGVLYVTDFAHGAVLAVQDNGEQEVIVGTYEDKPLIGPNSIIYASNGNVFFTDSGPFGETGLHNKTGSLFMVSNGGSAQMLRPVSLENLASPSGVAISPDGKFVYVAEMMTNRILRFFQKPDGVYHASVYYQLQGRVGPTAIVCDKQGCLYIGHYDTVSSCTEGHVLVLSKTGKLMSTIVTTGPEISGLAIQGNTLYITEVSTGSVFKVDL